MVFLMMLVFFGIFVLAARSAANGGSGRAGLLRNGVPARGLVLQANSFSTEQRVGGQRFELRALTLDVEIPGNAPYEVAITPLIPPLCEALPGATFDLRVDRRNNQNIAIVGPAGSSDWLAAAARMPGQTWVGPVPGLGTSVLPKGCGTIFVVIVGMSLALASVLEFIGEHRSHQAAEPATAPTHDPPAHDPPAHTSPPAPAPKPAIPARPGAKPVPPHH